MIEKLSKLLTVLTRVTTAAIIWCLTLSEQNLLSTRYILILEIAMSFSTINIHKLLWKVILSWGCNWLTSSFSLISYVNKDSLHLIFLLLVYKMLNWYKQTTNNWKLIQQRSIEFPCHLRRNPVTFLNWVVAIYDDCVDHLHDSLVINLWVVIIMGKWIISVIATYFVRNFALIKGW